jgi:hypothetical protein
MLPKRQVKGPEVAGPPKYQPPPQVSKTGVPTAGVHPPAAPMQMQMEIKQPGGQVKSKEMPRPASTGPILDQEIIRPVSPSRGMVSKRPEENLMRPSHPPLERPTWKTLSDEELLHRPPQEVLRIVRAAEAEIGRLQTDHNQWLQDARARLQGGANELRAAQVNFIFVINNAFYLSLMYDVLFKDIFDTL